MIRKNVILEVVVPWVVPILLAFAVLLFLKGHNSPGGGFIAGLLTAAAIVLRFITFGSVVHQGTGHRYIYLIAAGLAVAAVEALVPTFFGYAFFTQTFGHVHVPVLGDIELASAALFDLGVYMVVVGNVVTVIAVLTERG